MSRPPDGLAMTAPIVITGRAYQRRATLEVRGETLAWRARRGQLTPVAENIATTCHEIRDVTWLEKRWSLGAVALAALATMWVIEGELAFGVTTAAAALGLVIWHRLRPRYWLGLDLGTRWLVLRVDRGAADEARALARRIEHHLEVGRRRPPAGRAALILDGAQRRSLTGAPPAPARPAKKSLPLSSTTMNAGKSTTSIFHTASMPSSAYSRTSTFLMQSFASRAAGPPIEPR